ncbi:MAG: flagellar hook assembly protein FlgD [Nitrospiria bacterium]
MELAGVTATENDPLFSTRISEKEEKTGAAKSLGKDSFLKLLTTQLRHQNPLEPMDSTEFVAQLAQFSQVEQMTTVNQTLDQLLQSNGSLSNFAVADLMGREVQMVGGAVAHQSELPSKLNYRLEGDAGKVIIQISDAAGRRVKTIDAGAQKSGVWEVSWDGRDGNGNSLPSGAYHYSVSAVDSSGAPLGSTTYSTGQVTGVSYDGGIPYLTVNGNRFAAASLVSITN